jgi:hypothetical protein
MEKVIKLPEVINDHYATKYNGILKMFDGLTMSEAFLILEQLRRIFYLNSRIEVTDKI